MADTLTDIHAAVGDLLNAPTDADPSVDETIDAELDAKAGEDSEDIEESGLEDETEEGEPSEPAAEVEAAEPEAPEAKPFQYTVDGAEKAYPGGQLLVGKDGSIQGATFAAEQVKDLQYRLQRGEYLENQNKTLYEKTREFDAVTVPDRATGQEYKGMAAVEHLVVENARQHAALQLMADTLENPDKLIALALAVQSGDTSPLQAMTDRLRLMAENATYKTKAQFSERVSKAKETQAQDTDRSSITQQAIGGAIQQWASQFPTLTKDDLAKAEAHFSKLGTAIVRPATPDEAKAAGVKPGELVIDHPVIYEWLQDRAELRKSVTTASTAAEKAAKENAARLSARQAKRPATPATKPKPKATVPDDSEETWAQQKNRLLTGQLGMGSDD